MAMNETYNLTINGDGSKLNKELETILTNLKAIENQNMSKPLKDYEQKIRKAVDLNKQLQKIMSKNEGNTIVSSKDMNSSLKITQEMTKHMKDLQGVLQDVQKTGLSKGIKADYDMLHQTLNGLNGTMSQTIKQQKEFNSLKTTRDPNVQAMIKDWERLGKMPKEYKQSMKEIDKTKEANKTLNKQRNRITSANERERRDGKYSARDGAGVSKALNQDYDQYRNELKKAKASLKELRKKQDDIARNQEKTNTDYSSNKIGENEHREQTAYNSALSSQYDKEIKEREKYVSNLKSMTKDLGNNGATRQQFEQGRVARSRDTFLGTALERAPSIASHATMGVGGALGLQYAQGKSSLEGIRGEEIALGQQTGASDYSSLRKNLFQASDDRGLGFKPSELVKMSSQAMQAIGDKGLPNQQEITTELATGARGMGVADTDSYLKSMTDIMHSGGIDDDVDLKQFQKTVSGGIKESGMKAQADEQLKALSSMSNTMGAQRELSTGDLNSIASLQGTFAESGNKALQGEKGANALTQIQQGIAGAYQDPSMRNIMGFGSEYTGVTGAWQQRRDLGDPSKLGENLSQFMGFYGTSTDEGRAATGMGLMDNFGLSGQQAEEIMKLYDNGDLSEEELGKKVKEYQGSSEIDKNNKDQSEQQQGKDNQNQSRQEAQSQALYESTGALRNFQGMLAGLNPVFYQIMVAGEALVASMASSAAMMGGAYGMKRAGGAANRRGSNMTRQRADKDNKSGKGTNLGGTPGGRKRAGKESNEKDSGSSGIVDGGMMSGMMMGGMMGSPFGGGDTQEGGQRKGMLGKIGQAGGRMARFGMMPMMMGSMMSGGQTGGQTDEQGNPTGGSPMGSMATMMIQMMAMEALMNGGIGKLGDLGKKGFEKGKGTYGKGKDSYKKSGAKRLGKRAGIKFLKGDRALRGFPNMAKGKLSDLAKSEKVSKTESVLGKGFDKTKGFAQKGFGKLSSFGGQTPTGNMSKTLGKGSGMLGKLGKVGKFGKGIPLVGGALSALGIGSSLMQGDMKGASGGVGATAGATIGGTLGSIVPGIGTAIGATAGGLLGGKTGEFSYDTTKKNNEAIKKGNIVGKDGLIDFNWSNGDKDGKGGFGDSVVGKPVMGAVNGIKSLFGGGDKAKGGGGGGQGSTGIAGAYDDTENLEGKENSIKSSDNKKKKMTAEELRRKNNKSESENLNMFKNLLTRWEQSIQEAKGLDTGGDSDSGDSGGSASDVGGEGAEKIYKFLKGKGLSDNQAAAVMGNLYQESKLDPNAVNSSSGAYGIAQWTGARKTGLDNFAKKQGKKSSDLDVQLDYLWKEMESGYDADMLRNAGWSENASLEKNTTAFANGFERMGADEAMMSTRTNQAKAYKKKYGGGGGGKDWSSEPSYTNRSMATLQNQQATMTQPTSGNTANVSVSINITGGDSPTETAQAVRDRLDSYFDSSDFDIFQNNYRRT
ncbi:tail length tape-measure protein [Staphylococcus phage vB_SsapH-Golestan101-M]|nr:tail length tape-measure protein [Staphylococcus phage vB_SsapH-Golestan101-M]